MIKKNLLLLFNLMAYSSVLIAQSNNAAVDVLSNNSGVSDMVPNGSPIKMVDYLGKTDISIPLYTISVDGLDIPIKLTYDPNRLKVNDAASWVGYGWELDIPNKITRSVNRLPDDIRKTNTFEYMSTPIATTNNPYKYGFAQGGADLAVSFNGNHPDNKKNVAELAAMNFHIRDFTSLIGGTLPHKAFDPEPDIFYYTLPNNSGKFIYGANNKKYTIPYDDITILEHFNYNFWPGSYDIFTYGFDEFYIYDSKGHYYEFNQKTAVKAYSEANYQGTTCAFIRTGGSAPAYWGYNEWYTNKIYTYNKKQIDFTYTDFVTEENFQTRQTVDGNLSFVSGGHNTARYDQTMKILTKRITKIETDKEIVEFIAGHNRQDVLAFNNSPSNALTEIKIYKKENGNNILIKRYLLTYNYFATTADVTNIPGGATPFAHYPLSDIYDKSKRLKLLSIQEFSGNNISLPAIKFTYNNDISFNNPNTSLLLPCRYSVEQDVWGYFNNNNSTHMFPTLYIYPNKSGVDRITVFKRNDWAALGEVERVLNGVDRSANSFAVRGALKKITYPTGGYTEYEFENNSSYWGGENRYTGGIRIKSVKVHDAVNSDNDILTEFSYNLPGISPARTSGIMITYPILGYTENVCPYFSSTIGANVVPDNYSPTSFNYFNLFCKRLSVPVFNSGFDIGVYSGYTTITVSNVLNGKKEISFDVPGEYGQTSLVQKYVNNGLNAAYSVPQMTKAISGMLTGGVFELYDNQPDMTGIDFSAFSYWGAPRVNLNWARGTVSGIKYFDVNNQLRKEDIYNYALFTGDNEGIKLIDAIKYGTFQAENITRNGVEAEAYSNDCWYYSKYKQVANCKMVQVKHIVNDYTTNGIITEESNYTYAGTKPYPTKISYLKSNGDEMITNIKYPFSYTFSHLINSTKSDEYNALHNLTVANKWGEVIEKTTEVKPPNQNAKTIRAIYNEYKMFTQGAFSVPQLFRTWDLEIDMPLTNFVNSKTANPSGTYLVQKDTRYVAQHEYTKRDNVGNLTEVQDLKTNSKMAFKWWYSGNYPVATIKNAALNDVAYTSFEEYAPGRTIYGDWNIGTSSSIQASGSIMGSNYLKLNAGIWLNSNTLTPGKKYKVSLWVLGGAVGINNGGSNLTLTQGLVGMGGWTYYEGTFVDNGGGVGVWPGSGNPHIDDLRLYPADADMATQTYNVLIGKSSDCDMKGDITNYQYDDFGNLHTVRDVKNSIIQKIDTKVQASDN